MVKEYEQYIGIITRLKKDGKSIRTIRKNLLERYPNAKKIPSTATIGRLSKEVDNNLENGEKEEVLEDIKASFKALKKKIENTKELTYKEVGTSYYNKRGINREWREVFTQIDGLNTEIDNLVSSYFSKKDKIIMEIQTNILNPLTERNPEVKSYLKQLIKDYIEK
jgi:hypothetical protein